MFVVVAACTLCALCVSHVVTFRIWLVPCSSRSIYDSLIKLRVRLLSNPYEVHEFHEIHGDTCRSYLHCKLTHRPIFSVAAFSTFFLEPRSIPYLYGLSMASNDKTTTYRIIRVPKASPRMTELVTKFRSTRLDALMSDAASFLSKYAVESALVPSVWHRRFSNTQTMILACISISNPTADSDPETNLIENEWVGFAAVRGPMEYADYYVTPDMGLPIPGTPENETRWHVYDLYTLPQHRGKGLARRLVNECIAIAMECTTSLNTSLLPPTVQKCEVSSQAAELKQARIRLFMDPKNIWLINMYESMGFKVAGKVTLEEGFRANALDESIPVDTRKTEGSTKLWHTRFGVAMEQVVHLG